MDSINLRPAFVWDCPNCESEQFDRAIQPEFGDEELDELRTDFGIQPWEAGKFHQMPKRVRCKGCKTVFKAETFIPEDA